MTKFIVGLIILIFLVSDSYAALIDGPANIRVVPNGKILFSLNDDVNIDIVSLKKNWYIVSVDIVIGAYALNPDTILKKGVKLYDKNNREIGETINKFKVFDSWIIKQKNNNFYVSIKAYTHKNNIKNSILSNKVAFLRNGDIWVYSLSKNTEKRVTSTNGSIKDFLFSPDLKHVAYLKISDKKRKALGVVILNLKKNIILKEIVPTSNCNTTVQWLDKWLSNDIISYTLVARETEQGPMGVNSTFNIQTKNENDDDSDNWTDISIDETIKVFHTYKVKTNGDGGSAEYDILILENLVNNERKTILSAKRRNSGVCINQPKISHKNLYVAVIEDYGKIWIYNIQNNSLKMVEKKFRGKLSWSYSDKYLGIFYHNKSLIIEVENPLNIHETKGLRYSWTNTDDLIFEKDNNIYQYNLSNKKDKLIITDGSIPKFLIDSLF